MTNRAATGPPVRDRHGMVTAAFTAAAVVPSAVMWLIAWSRLPDRPATHFGIGGNPDGFLGRTAFLALGLGLQAAVAAVSTVVVVRRRGAGGTRWTAAFAAGIAALLAGATVATLAGNLDVVTGHAAHLPWWSVPAVFAGAVAAGAAAWFLAGPDPLPREGDADAAEAVRLALRRGETVVWTRRVTSPLLLLITGALAVAGAAMWLSGGWGAGVPLLAVGALTGVFATVRVTVDFRGLTVAFGRLPWPRLRIPLDRMEEASHRGVSPLAEFGGWGYRIRPGASGLVLRSGDALTVRRGNGRSFVVTVADAATGAAVLNGLIDRDRRVRN